MSKPKLIIPAVSFLAGLILWIVFLLWGNPETPGLQWIGSLLCLLIAGVFYYSAVQCRQVTGGRKGNRLRGTVLVFMAIVTYFQSAPYGALILWLAAVVIAVMAGQGSDFGEAEQSAASRQDRG